MTTKIKSPSAFKIITATAVASVTSVTVVACAALNNDKGAVISALALITASAVIKSEFRKAVTLDKAALAAELSNMENANA